MVLNVCVCVCVCVCVIINVLTRPNPLFIVCTCSKARRGNFGRWGISGRYNFVVRLYTPQDNKINCSSVWCRHYTFSCTIMHFQAMNWWWNCPTKKLCRNSPALPYKLTWMFNFYCLRFLWAAHILHLYTRRWMVSSSTSFLSVKCTCKCTFGSKLIKCALSSKNFLVTLLILTEFLGSNKLSSEQCLLRQLSNNKCQPQISVHLQINIRGMRYYCEKAGEKAFPAIVQKQS